MYLPFPIKEWDKQEWAQIKNLTKKEIISLLDKDNRWKFVKVNGGRYIYHNPKLKSPHEYLAIHYHSKEGYRDKGLLKKILNHWCCTKDDFKEWGVIK